MGNPTSYFGNDLSWDGKKLMEVSYDNGIDRPIVYSYAYDENGLRLEKTVSGTTTEYYYNGSVLIGMRIGTTKFLRFSYDAAGSVVAVDYSTDGGSTFTTYYYLRNAQNDVIKLIDGSGNTVVEYTYDSWGKIISSTGTLANTVGTDQPFRYRGYVYDEETEWYYLQSRYYDPTTCRFISADVYLSTGQGVIGHNAFAYCLNNPVNLIDCNGARANEATLDIFGPPRLEGGGGGSLLVLISCTISEADTTSLLSWVTSTVTTVVNAASDIVSTNVQNLANVLDSVTQLCCLMLTLM